MTILLIIIALLLLQCWRYRGALDRSIAEANQIADDYQSLGDDYHEEVSRLEDALDRIADGIVDDASAHAARTLRGTSSIELMRKYAPENAARIKRENELWRSLGSCGAFQLPRWRRAFDFLVIWWQNPSAKAIWPRLKWLASILRG